MLFILLGVLVGLLFLRNDVEASVLRLPGQLFEHKGDKISNVYTYKIVNKTNKDFTDVRFELVSPKGEIKSVGSNKIVVKRGDFAQGTIFIEIEAFRLESDKSKLQIAVYNGDILLESTTTNFLSPRSFN